MRIGVMVAGLTGNNGSTLYAALHLHRLLGRDAFDWYGSVSQHGSVAGQALRELLPELLDPNRIAAIGGWDVDPALSLAEAIELAGVVPPAEQKTLRDNVPDAWPLRAAYYPGFTRLPREPEVTLPLDKEGDRRRLAEDIDRFAHEHKLEFVAVVYSGSTERSVPLRAGLNDTAENFRRLFAADPFELLSPSMVYACAAHDCQTACLFVNAAAQDLGSVRGLHEATEGTLLVGDDLATGNTLTKTVLGEMFLRKGFRLDAITSFNFLGNRDGFTVSQGKPNTSKIHTKSSMTDAFRGESPGAYRPEEEIEHVVRIEHVRAAGDLKRAQDTFLARGMFGSTVDFSLSVQYPDTPLACAVLLDLILFAHILTTRNFRDPECNALLSVFLKKPTGRPTSPFFSDRLKALLGVLLEL